MNPLLYYLLQMIAASALLYGYYHLALRNKKFHRYNRFYLLAAVLISILIPFLNIPVYFSESETESSFVFQTLKIISYSAVESAGLSVTAAEATNSSWFTLSTVLWTVYILVALIVFLKIIFSLKRLRDIAKNNPVEKLQEINFVNTDEPGTPFSFFRWLFWNRKIELRSEKGGQIFRHELFHIQQKHSLDIIFMELLTAICWFNPFFHLVRKELKTIHEFLADEFALNENARPDDPRLNDTVGQAAGRKKWQYAELLLMQALNTKNHLVNPFFHNQIKRRIAMITSSSKPGHQYLQKLLVLPVAAVVVALFAFSFKENAKENSQLKMPIETNINFVQDTIKPGLQRVDSTFKPSVTIQNKDTGRLLVIDAVIKGTFTDFKKIDQWLKPEDVQSINVLKGTLATELYGAIGKNGVIEITTKKKLENATVKTDIAEKPNLSGYENYLIVLDGVLMNEMKSVQLDSLVLPGDILHINVLKGPAASVLYGEKGKNGVIEINTKKKTAQINIIKNNSPFAEYKPDERNKFFNKAEVDPLNQDKINGNVNEVIADIGGKDYKLIFERMEADPSFDGGETAWRKFLEENINPNIPIDSGANAGKYTVIAQFIVHKDGSISDLKTLTKHGFGMEEEVMRIMKKSPNWIPAIQNGHKVTAYRKQPVTFVVSEE
jgi:TonB-dependent SusC/RagA subfamily outer membrane receptor